MNSYGIGDDLDVSIGIASMPSIIFVLLILLYDSWRFIGVVSGEKSSIHIFR